MSDTQTAWLIWITTDYFIIGCILTLFFLFAIFFLDFIDIPDFERKSLRTLYSYAVLLVVCLTTPAIMLLLLIAGFMVSLSVPN